MDTPSLVRVDRFLALKRIAFIGVSRNPRDFSRGLFGEFLRRGYDVVPVNPAVETMDGLRCYRTVKAISPRVDGALVMAPKSALEKVIRDCADAEIRQVWLYGLRGPKEFGSPTSDHCDELNIEMIAGYCPYMFFPKTQFFHTMHGVVMKIMGSYPQRPKHHVA
ncbi:MAG: CoA-binding protein [Ignavibacteria bacterium]|nr:CoA-binding protein [Ignavibacteria bacterium]